MYLRSLKNDPLVWKVFQFLEEMEDRKNLKQIQFELDIEEFHIQRALQAFAELGVSVKTEKIVNEHSEPEIWLYPPGDIPKAKVEISVSDWLALSSFVKGKSQAGIKEKTISIVKKFEEALSTKEKTSDLNLSQALRELDRISSVDKDEGVLNFNQVITKKSFNFNIKIVEDAIENAHCLILKTRDKESFEFFPHRMVVQNDEMTLVGEDRVDHCLGFLNLENVERVELGSMEFKPRFSLVEVNSFIAGLREINDNKLRLVLKVLDSDLDVNPPLQFIERPYVAINWEGHRIWGATLETNDELFFWLENLGSRVEILDPSSFKNEYMEFCKRRLSEETLMSKKKAA